MKELITEIRVNSRLVCYRLNFKAKIQLVKDINNLFRNYLKRG